MGTNLGDVLRILYGFCLRVVLFTVLSDGASSLYTVMVCNYVLVQKMLLFLFTKKAGLFNLPRPPAVTALRNVT